MPLVSRASPEATLTVEESLRKKSWNSWKKLAKRGKRTDANAKSQLQSAKGEKVKEAKMTCRQHVSPARGTMERRTKDYG